MSELRSSVELAADAGAPFRFAVVVSRYNEDVTSALLDGALETFAAHGAASASVYEVPGAFELPMTAARLVANGSYDSVVCLGALIRGETSHFDYLSASVAHALEDLSCSSGVPVIFGVLTCETLAQAEARAGGDRGNKGNEAALTAIEMAILFAAIAAEA
jgi:6,7-dimethyl-8-ribityllumazine synthase